MFECFQIALMAVRTIPASTAAFMFPQSLWAPSLRFGLQLTCDQRVTKRAVISDGSEGENIVGVTNLVLPVSSGLVAC